SRMAASSRARSPPASSPPTAGSPGRTRPTNSPPPARSPAPSPSPPPPSDAGRPSRAEVPRRVLAAVETEHHLLALHHRRHVARPLPDAHEALHHLARVVLTQIEPL